MSYSAIVLFIGTYCLLSVMGLTKMGYLCCYGVFELASSEISLTDVIVLDFDKCEVIEFSVVTRSRVWCYSVEDWVSKPTVIKTFGRNQSYLNVAHVKGKMRPVFSVIYI